MLVVGLLLSVGNPDKAGAALRRAARSKAREENSRDLWAIDKMLHAQATVRDLYSEFSPQKSDEATIDDLVLKWRGQEHGLLTKLADKYKIPGLKLTPKNYDLDLSSINPNASTMPLVARWASDRPTQNAYGEYTGAEALTGTVQRILAAAPVTIFCVHDQTREKMTRFLRACARVAKKTRNKELDLPVRQ
jgi:hypothetical protein